MNYVIYIFQRLSLLVIFLPTSLYTQSTKTPEQWIVIHGTFAANSDWPQQNSPAHQALAKSVADATNNNFTTHTFRWSGHNNHNARLQAADELLSFLSKLTPPYHVVAHSHGVTVALLAAEKMVSKTENFLIEELFSLGVPVYLPWYPNAHTKVKNFYNVFSYGDTVQTVVSLFERTFPEQPHVHNIQIKINHSCPQHSDLHDPLVLTTLPRLRTMVDSKKKKDTDRFLLQISARKNNLLDAALEYEESREADLKADQHFRNQLITLYGESRTKLQQKVLVPLLPSSLQKKETCFQ